MQYYDAICLFITLVISYISPIHTHTYITVKNDMSIFIERKQVLKTRSYILKKSVRSGLYRWNDFCANNMI